MQHMAETVRQLQARQQQLEANLVQARTEATAARAAAAPGDAGAPAPRAPAAASVGVDTRLLRKSWTVPVLALASKPQRFSGFKASKLLSTDADRWPLKPGTTVCM